MTGAYVSTHVERGFSSLLSTLTLLAIHIIVSFACGLPILPLTSPTLPSNKSTRRVWKIIRNLIDVAFQHVTEWIQSLPTLDASCKRRERMRAIRRSAPDGYHIRRHYHHQMACCITVLVMSAQTKPKQHLTPFDTDSKPIGINNRYTACISHDLNDFEKATSSNRSGN
jgi:hypothetical protein